MIQQLALGKNYRVTFKPEFVIHGYQQATDEQPNPTFLHEGKGVVTVEAMMSFNDCVKSGISLYDSFFKPCGITEDEYKVYFGDGVPDNREVVVDEDTGEVITPAATFSSVVNYSKFPIYKFVDVFNPDDAFYVPEQAIASFPEVDINEYVKVMMTVDLGVFKDVEQLNAVKTAVATQLDLFGIRDSAIGLTIYDRVWLDTLAYEQVVGKRIPNSTESVTLTADNFSSYANLNFIVNTAPVVDSQGATVYEAGTVIRLRDTDQHRALFTGKTVSMFNKNNSSLNYFLQWKMALAENVELKNRIAADEEIIQGLLHNNSGTP